MATVTARHAPDIGRGLSGGAGTDGGSGGWRRPDLPAAQWPPVLGFVGPSGAGKTTLLERLLPLWRDGGLRVGAVKHAHHPLRAGDPRADSARLRAAGAVAVVAAEWRWCWEDAVRSLLEAAPDVDLVVLEGYHAAPVVQVLVLPARPALRAARARARGWVVAAVAPDAARRVDDDLRWWPRGDAAGLARWLAASCRPFGPSGARVAPVVLAGGRSRRMGRDKAALTWEGERWLERVRRAAETASGGVALVVGRRRRDPGGTPDLVPGQGPLAALVAAWYRVRAPWTLLCACDMPLLTAEPLAVLLQHASAAEDDARGGAAEAEGCGPAGGSGTPAAVLPVLGGRRQYACGVYARCGLASAIAALGRGERSLRAWVDGLPVREVGETAWTARGIDPGRAFADLDDREAVARWRPR